jgi:hypothetical protein
MNGQLIKIVNSTIHSSDALSGRCERGKRWDAQRSFCVSFSGRSTVVQRSFSGSFSGRSAVVIISLTIFFCN